MNQTCMAVQICPQVSTNPSGVNVGLTVTPGNSNNILNGNLNFSIVPPNSQPAPGCNVVSVCDYFVVQTVKPQ
jgi:hypothetical protein